MLRLSGILTGIGVAFVLAGLIQGDVSDAGDGGPGGGLAAWLTPLLLAVFAWVQLMASRQVEGGGSRLWWLVAFGVFAGFAVQTPLDRTPAGGLKIAWLAVDVLGMACLLMPSARSHLWSATPLADTAATEHDAPGPEGTEHDI